MSQKVMDWEGERVPKINQIWMLARIKNRSKNWLISRSKFGKMKKTHPKIMFFSLAFCYRFWRGLGRVLGGVWSLLGHFLASLFDAFIWNALQKGSWRLLGSILARFWRVWGGFWGGFWKVLRGLGESKIVVLLDRVFRFRVLVAGAFGGVWAKKVP